MVQKYKNPQVMFLPKLRVQSVRILLRKHLISTMQGRQSVLDLWLITGFTCLKAKRVHYTPKTPFFGVQKKYGKSRKQCSRLNEKNVSFTR